VLEELFASRPAQHWEDTLLAADVGCVVAHREPPESVLQSAEFAGAADMLVQVEHPTFGDHVRLRPYVSFSRSATVAEPGVLAGEHTDAILSELGYSTEAVADLRERKVVA
jgi:crotonobetainyl-CoA:carnitine CoA-transferase CaiB-like acyl-CoA transferase